MKGIIIVLLIFIQVAQLQGQEYLDGEPIWYIRETMSHQTEPGFYEISFKFKLGKDTIIKNSQYKELVKARFEDSTNYVTTWMYLRENLDTIFYRQRGIGEERILFINDFLKGFIYKEHEGCDFTIIDFDTITNQGKKFERWHYEISKALNRVFVEDVGFEETMFWETACQIDAPRHHLVCLVRNEKVLYKKAETQNCYYEEILVTSIKENKQEVRIYPSIVSIGQKVNLEIANEREYQIEIINSNGELERSMEFGKDGIEFQNTGMKYIRVTESSGRVIRTMKIMVY